MRPRADDRGRLVRLAPTLLALTVGLVAIASCGSSSSTPAPTPFTPGVSAAPRNVVVQMYDYRYVPTVIDLVPGETVNLQVIDGGMVVHEAVFGDMPAQLAWEAAEAATLGAPPGPTPFVSPPPGFDGTRIVAASGQRVDVVWTVPSDAPAASSGWFLGCHIPGHWAKGMVVPVRFVNSAGQPIASTPPIPSILPTPAGG